MVNCMNCTIVNILIMLWTTLFSQTGSEIVKLCESIGRKPDNIITDNNDYSKWHPGLRNVTVVPKLSLKDSNVLRDLLGNSNNTLVTLHGWLHIIPEDICNEYNIYNGHPGLITAYPELKGKDPQARCWANIKSYDVVGSVVHKVTPVVDDGKVLTHSYIQASECKSLEDTHEKLRKTSYDAWIQAFSVLL